MTRAKVEVVVHVSDLAIKLRIDIIQGGKVALQELQALLHRGAAGMMQIIGHSQRALELEAQTVLLLQSVQDLALQRREARGRAQAEALLQAHFCCRSRR